MLLPRPKHVLDEVELKMRNKRPIESRQLVSLVQTMKSSFDHIQNRLEIGIAKQSVSQKVDKFASFS